MGVCLFPHMTKHNLNVCPSLCLTVCLLPFLPKPACLCLLLYLPKPACLCLCDWSLSICLFICFPTYLSLPDSVRLLLYLPKPAWCCLSVWVVHLSASLLAKPAGLFLSICLPVICRTGVCLFPYLSKPAWLCLSVWSLSIRLSLCFPSCLNLFDRVYPSVCLPSVWWVSVCPFPHLPKPTWMCLSISL